MDERKILDAIDEVCGECCRTGNVECDRCSVRKIADRFNHRFSKIDETVVNGFMAGMYDGRCPVCGGAGEAQDSDEGTGDNHWFERLWRCEDCGAEFEETFWMKPMKIELCGEEMAGKCTIKKEMYYYQFIFKASERLLREGFTADPRFETLDQLFYAKSDKKLESMDDAKRFLEKTFPVTEEFNADMVDCLKPSTISELDSFYEIDAKEFEISCGVKA